MKPAFLYIALYFWCLFFEAVKLIYFGEKFSILLKSKLFWLTPFFYIGIGLFIAFALSRARKSASKKLYMMIPIISCIAFMSLSFYLNYMAARHERDFGNIAHNDDYFKYWVESYKNEKRIAFDTLLTNFKNKNDIRIESITSVHYDTIKNSLQRTCYSVEIVYKNQMLPDLFKSNIIVILDTGYLIHHNTKITEYEKYKMDSIKHEDMKIIRETFKAIPDSVKKKLDKELNNILD